MNILLLGGGGREHAFAWKIVSSPKCTQLYVAPGNAGTANIAKNIPISPNDFKGLADFSLANQIEMIVVGPEEPLVIGVTDYFKNNTSLHHIMVIGPSRTGAQLEGSKDFSKKFMQKYGIPTAAYDTFTKQTVNDGIAFLRKQQLPIVLKADGLAAGKGVLICQSHEEAEASLREMLVEEKFGKASKKVVIEQFLKGIELSVFVATDGKSYKILPEAKDYKRIGEGDTGLNTGGMGAVSPVPFADAAFLKKVKEKIIAPSVEGLKQENIPYVGFLFIGLMNDGGEPYVIEYNVRMGDPETEAVLPRIKSDFVDMLLNMGKGTLDAYDLELEDFTCTTVVVVAGGYPGDYEKGKKIEGVQSLIDSKNPLVFHAGTKTGEKNEVLTNGGRVLAITGIGSDVQTALDNAYIGVSKVCWDGMNFRKDIGQDILKLNK